MQQVELPPLGVSYTVGGKAHKKAFVPTSGFVVAGELVCFDVYLEYLLEVSPGDVKIHGFEVSLFQGWLCGYRTEMPSPAGIYTTLGSLLDSVFNFCPDLYANVALPPAPRPHPLVTPIPAGLPGAGILVVHDVFKLAESSGGIDRRGVESAVGQMRVKLEGARKALKELGVLSLESPNSPKVTP